jgi:hypothetical protein
VAAQHEIQASPRIPSIGRQLPRYR